MLPKIQEKKATKRRRGPGEKKVYKIQKRPEAYGLHFKKGGEWPKHAGGGKLEKVSKRAHRKNRKIGSEKNDSR